MFDNAKYQTEYIKNKLKRYEFRASKEKEADIIEWLEAQKNLQSYIKQLVREDMEKHQST